jgi:transketolase
MPIGNSPVKGDQSRKRYLPAVGVVGRFRSWYEHAPCRLLFERQGAAYKKAVLGTTRARVAVEAAVELGWERCTGFEGRFIGMHSFGASGKIADVNKKFDINAEAAVRAAHETLAEVAAL